MNRANNSNLRTCRMILFMILAMTSSIGWADHGGSRHAPMGLTVPASSTGNYSVSWTTTLPVQLQEKVGSGAYNTIYTGNSSPQLFTDKAPGTYTYRLYRVRYSQRRGRVERYSAPVTTVVVAPLPPDPSNHGFRGEYRAYSGDLNGDGYADLVVSRFNGESGPLAPDNFALMQNLNQTFSIDDTLTPTEVNIAQSWPESSVSLIQRDINVDGRFDFLVKGLSQDSNFASSTVDQIVFAPNTAPIHVRPADAEFLQFMADTYGWMKNQNYFENTAIANGWYEYQGEEQTGWWYISYINTYYSYGNGNSFLAVDDDPNDPNNLPAFCENYPWLCWFNPWAGSWLVYGTFLANIQVVIDYTNFNQEARQFAAAAGDAIHDPAAAATIDLSAATQIMETELEVEVGDTVAGILIDQLPWPVLPQETQPKPAKPPPWDPDNPEDGANDPNVDIEFDWVILGRIPIIICGLFICADDLNPGEDEFFIWRDYGIAQAIRALLAEELNENEKPNVVIGEGERHPAPYLRIPAAAVQYGAMYFQLTDSQDQGLPKQDGQWTHETDVAAWAVNLGWMSLMISSQAVFYDIGLYEGRSPNRGIFYPCERQVLEGYFPRNEVVGIGTLNHTYGVCDLWN